MYQPINISKKAFQPAWKGGKQMTENPEAYIQKMRENLKKQKECRNQNRRKETLEEEYVLLEKDFLEKFSDKKPVYDKDSRVTGYAIRTQSGFLLFFRYRDRIVFEHQKMESYLEYWMEDLAEWKMHEKIVDFMMDDWSAFYGL
jgi:hypothetical protein